MTGFCLVFLGVFVLMYVTQPRSRKTLERRLWENRVSKRELVELSLRRNSRLYLSSHGRLYYKRPNGIVCYVNYRVGLTFVQSSVLNERESFAVEDRVHDWRLSLSKGS